MVERASPLQLREIMPLHIFIHESQIMPRFVAADAAVDAGEVSWSRRPKDLAKGFYGLSALAAAMFQDSQPKKQFLVIRKHLQPLATDFMGFVRLPLPIQAAGQQGVELADMRFCRVGC